MKFCSIVLILISFQFLGNSASAQKQKKDRFAPDPAMIPPDFNPNKHILLVMQLPKRNNPEKIHAAGTKDIDEAFKANYKNYKYEIVSPADLRNDSIKYTDTSVYRFILFSSAISSPRVDGGYTVRRDASTGVNMRTPNAPLQVKSTFIDFYFYDRLNNKEYPGGGKPMNFVKMTLRPILELLVQHAEKMKDQ